MLAAHSWSYATDDREPVILARISRRQAGRKFGGHAERDPELCVDDLIDAVKGHRSNTGHNEGVAGQDHGLADHALVAVESAFPQSFTQNDDRRFFLRV